MNYLRITALFTGLAGISHITLQAYSHFGMPFYLVSFLLVGILQIALSVFLWKGMLSPRLFWFTTLVNGGSIIFWLLTRVVVAPFVGGVEHITINGLLVVAFQLISIIFLCLTQKKLSSLFLVLLGSIGLGVGGHFGAMQLEHHFPELKGSGHHHEGGHHKTMSDKEHKNMMDHHKTESTESNDNQGEDPAETQTHLDNNHDEPHGH